MAAMKPVIITIFDIEVMVWRHVSNHHWDDPCASTIILGILYIIVYCFLWNLGGWCFYPHSITEDNEAQRVNVCRLNSIEETFCMPQKFLEAPSTPAQSDAAEHSSWSQKRSVTSSAWSSQETLSHPAVTHSPFQSWLLLFLPRSPAVSLLFPSPTWAGAPHPILSLRCLSRPTQNST